MLEISPDTPDHILVISAVGRVTDDDYRTLLIPAAEEKIRRHGKIRMLYQIGPRFESFAPRAVMDDALFGLKHLGHFERIAVVTDVEWCRHAVGMMGWMVPCPVRLFANDQIAAAQAWIRELS